MKYRVDTTVESRICTWVQVGLNCDTQEYFHEWPQTSVLCDVSELLVHFSEQQ